MNKPTKSPAATPRLFAVILPPGKRPGLRACGELEPGTSYDRDASEALRLVRTKGFEFVNPADREAAEAIVNTTTEA